MKKFVTFLALPLAAFFVSCGDDNDGASSASLNELKSQYVETYVAIVKASYADALTATENLQTAVNAFVDAPTSDNFEAAKQAWLDAREPYGQTEVYRFYDGPIDGNDGEPEGYINAWPLDEALIDYVADGTGGQSGSTAINIIGDATTYPQIDGATLRSTNGLNDSESNVTLGYHAVEFLLWGQDNDDPSERTTGSRSYTDYTIADNAERRAAYLKTVTDILVADLSSVVDQWNGAYETQFLALDSDEAISMILTGAAKLSKGELAGERMAAAVRDQDQENEHSCFADNTHRDIFLNAQGISNVLNGTYGSVAGTSIYALLAVADNSQVSSLQTTAAEVMTKATVIAEAEFFDALIIGETLEDTSKPVMSTVASLENQGDLISAATLAITGVTITGNLE